MCRHFNVMRIFFLHNEIWEFPHWHLAHRQARTAHVQRNFSLFRPSRRKFPAISRHVFLHFWDIGHGHCHPVFSCHSWRYLLEFWLAGAEMMREKNTAS
jgi:hypothetical protein